MSFGFNELKETEITEETCQNFVKVRSFMDV
jgi:hypothetical protein